MNIAAYIFCGLFTVSLVLSFAIPVKIAKKIFSCLIFPFMLGTTISLLINHTPDSIHNIIITACTFGLLSISIIFYNFKENKKFFDTLSSIFLILSFLPLINFLGSIFYLKHISQLAVIFSIFVYIVIAICMVIFLKKQTITFYLEAFISYILASFLNMLTFLSLIYETRLYGAFLFSGSLIVLLGYIFSILQTKVFKIKIGALISKISQIAGYSLISTGLYFMIAM